MSLLKKDAAAGPAHSLARVYRRRGCRRWEADARRLDQRGDRGLDQPWIRRWRGDRQVLRQAFALGDVEDGEALRERDRLVVEGSARQMGECESRFRNGRHVSTRLPPKIRFAVLRIARRQTPPYPRNATQEPPREKNF